MKANEIFFADSGLTSTSANHIANIAKEYIQSLESEVYNIQFYMSEVSIIGSTESNVLEDGTYDEELLILPEKLEQISEAKSLIAWLREAIKARKSMLEAVESLTLEQWANDNNITLPERPVKRAVLTVDDMYASRSIKERNHILSLQARAATIGKYIHPDGRFADERKAFHDKKRNKHEVKGEGRDTLIYTYTPSCSEHNLENVFFQLQKVHRETQAELNSIEHSINEAIRQDEMDASAAYSAAMSDYRICMQELEAKLNDYKISESRRIGALKIVVPNDLKPIYDSINKLGK